MKEKALDKIKKLLRLSKSDNPHEAALALQKAQEIMRAYSISENDILMSEVQEALSDSKTSKKVNGWFHRLALMVAGCFGCEVYYTNKYNSYEFYPGFVGEDPEAEIALYAFEVLRRQLKKARRDFIAGLPKQTQPKNRQKRADFFCHGWIYEVEGKVFALVPRREPTQKVKAYMQTKDLKSTNTKSHPKHNSRDIEAAFEGSMAAKNVTLHKGTGFVQPKQLQ